MQEILSQLGDVVPNALAALAILIIGWLAARLIAVLVRKALQRTDLDNRIASFFTGEDAAAVPIEDWVAKGVYYLILLFVLLAFFQVLGLTIIAQPLNELLNKLLTYLPGLLGAGLLLLIAWLVATLLRRLVSKVLAASKLDERLGAQVGVEEEGKVSLAQTLGDAVYWLVFLLFLPAILGALQLEGLLQPVQGLVDQVLASLPNLFAVGLILVIGWFAARIVQRIVGNLLAAVGIDRLSEQVGVVAVLGQQKLSSLIGLVVYVLILIPVLIAALDALKMKAITEPASNMLNTVLGALPAVFGAFLVLGIAYVVGRVVSGLITNLLTGLGFNAILARLGLGTEPGEGDRTPSEIVGYLGLVAIMFFAGIAALRMLNFDLLAEGLAQIIVFAGQVILGLIIFAIGLYLANLADKTIRASGASQAGLLALAARIAILVLTGAMALRQMGLANEIVNLTFGLLLGAIAVAAALAFGIGGREIAARELGNWLDAIRSKEEDRGA
jgi:TRAP-type mannitol/chloroaromatic compound transport system permease small subunit